MSKSNATKMTWQRFIAVLCAAPTILITIGYWGYSPGKTPIDLGLSLAVSNLICAASGLLFGIMFNNPEETFSKNIVKRAISGLISGGLSIWAFGGYLWLRGFPESVHKAELALSIVFAVLPGLILYKLITRK